MLIIDQTSVVDQEMNLAGVHFTQLLKCDRLAVAQACENEMRFYLDAHLQRRLGLNPRFDRVTGNSRITHIGGKANQAAQGHAAFWTDSSLLSHHLGMHRATELFRQSNGLRRNRRVVEFEKCIETGKLSSLCQRGADLLLGQGLQLRLDFAPDRRRILFVLRAQQLQSAKHAATPVGGVGARRRGPLLILEKKTERIGRDQSRCRGGRRNWSRLRCGRQAGKCVKEKKDRDRSQQGMGSMGRFHPPLLWAAIAIRRNRLLFRAAPITCTSGTLRLGPRLDHGKTLRSPAGDHGLPAGACPRGRDRLPAQKRNSRACLFYACRFGGFHDDATNARSTDRRSNYAGDREPEHSRLHHLVSALPEGS